MSYGNNVMSTAWIRNQPVSQVITSHRRRGSSTPSSRRRHGFHAVLHPRPHRRKTPPRAASGKAACLAAPSSCPPWSSRPAAHLLPRSRLVGRRASCAARAPASAPRWVAVRARVPVRRQGRARRRRRLARGGGGERERPFRAVHGRVLGVSGVARHGLFVRALGNGGLRPRRAN